ncbi:MAG: two-component hybrid sensor and regulator [Mucilaginibacter sp.]|nr:two-component hybrid sensor and regulator [Mucilaginibacter sp.]
MKYLISILFVIFIGVEADFAQTVTSIGLEQGLSNNSVNCVYQDHFGFMWFGTFDGLNRYDGSSLKKFRTTIGDSTSLPSQEVNTIAEDQLEDLWVGTEKGIGILDNQTFKFSGTYFSRYGHMGKLRKMDNPVYTIQTNRQGQVFVGTNALGLIVYNKGKRVGKQIAVVDRKRHFILANARLQSIKTDSHNQTWVVIDGIGVGLYDAVSDSVILMFPANIHVNTIREDINNVLWMGTNQGVLLLDTRNKVLSRYQFKTGTLDNARIFDLGFDKTNKLWIATDGDGIALADVFGVHSVKVMKQGNKGSITSDIVHAILVDKDQRKWFGTFGGGVDVIDNKKNQFRTIGHESNASNTLISNLPTAFCEDEHHNIWIGLERGGVSYWNPRSGEFKNYVHDSTDIHSISSNRVYSIVRDELNNLWIATYGGGVNKFDPRTGQFTTIPFVQQDKGLKYVKKLYIDAQKRIWAGCVLGRWPGNLEKGLYVYDQTIRKFVPVPYDVKPQIISITANKDDTIWVGNYTGFSQINTRTGATTSTNLGIPVTALFESNGNLWIGTYGRGLLLYDTKKHTFEQFTEKNGLSNNTILNIEEDNQHFLWMSTFNGLSKFDPVNHRSENFYAADGLQSNQFNLNAAGKLSNGELLFGGINGFNIFQPAGIKQFTDFPKLLLTAVRIANENIDAKSEFVKDAPSIYEIKNIVMPFDNAVLSLDFVALEFSIPEKINYAYYMEGWDKSWIYVNNLHSANYSKLNEGRYTLHIKCTNPSGVWNPAERLMYITVLPPWYRSWYAYVSYFCVLGAVIYLYLYYQKKQTRLSYEIKLANLKTVQEKEINEKRISFFTNISHELRAPLTLIINPIRELAIDKKDADAVDLNAVYRNTRRLLSMVDQLMLFRKTEEEISDLNLGPVNLANLCEEVFLCFNNQVKSKKINYAFEKPETGLTIHADREKLEIVFFNLLSNAVKYTPDHGSVVLKVEEVGGQAKVTISDTGPGIPPIAAENLFDKFYRIPGAPEKAESGFGIGLFISKKLVDIHSGRIGFQNRLNGGTDFFVMLPLTTEPYDAEYLPDIYNKISNLSSEIFPDISENIGTPGVSAGFEDKLTKMVSDKPVVMLIDDDAELRSYLKSLLIKEYQVIEADTAELGFTTIANSEPDIIVCDVFMNGMSGVDLCLKVKESPVLNYIPFILLTNSSASEIKLKGLENGADDYITKPFENDLLLARIKGILKTRRTLKSYFINEITLKNHSIKVSEEYRDFLSKCILIVEENLTDDAFNVKQLTAKLGMSQSALFKRIKSISGLSINEFIRFIRLRKAAELMINTNLQVKEIAFSVGFQQTHYFRAQFFKVFGLNPSEFINKHRSVKR